LNNLRDNLGQVPYHFIVSEYAVYSALSHLKMSKCTSDDVLSNRLLVDLADILAAPICAIINSSIRQGIVPSQWNIAKVVPIPKIIHPIAIKSDLRPISVTSAISKVAESFICSFFNSYFNSFIDINQFGCINSSRSTVHTLNKLSDILFSSSDYSANIIRVLFTYFSKAFDVLDHNVLLQKFLDYDFPPHIIAWSMSFLYEHSQYVRIRNRNSCCRA
jgi:hypothetical protein